MRFITVKNVKLGNMRKVQDWTVTPSEEIKNGFVTMQADNRIARVNLNDNTAILSSGKGGHQGFDKLMDFAPRTVPVSQEIVDQIKSLVEFRDDYKSGSITFMG